MEKLVVIVVSWNTSDLTRACLDSLYACLGRLETPSEVWVVDNASSDDSVCMIKNRFPQVRLIENTENVGFARANNQAIRQTDGSLCLFLNPDTVVNPGAIERLIAFMRENPRAAAVGPKLILGDGSIQRSIWSLPTLGGELRFCLTYYFPPLCWLFGRLVGNRRFNMASIRSPQEAEVVSAACLMIRRSVIEQVGLLGEDYFLFSEENDLFFRMRQAGLSGFYVPQAQVIHLVGQSRQQRSQIDSETNFLRSRLIYFRRTDLRRFTRVRHIYGFFLGWSTAFARVCSRLKGGRGHAYVELYQALRETLVQVR